MVVTSAVLYSVTVRVWGREIEGGQVALDDQPSHVWVPRCGFLCYRELAWCPSVSPCILTKSLGVRVYVCVCACARLRLSLVLEHGCGHWCGHKAEPCVCERKAEPCVCEHGCEPCVRSMGVSMGVFSTSPGARACVRGCEHGCDLHLAWCPCVCTWV